MRISVNARREHRSRRAPLGSKSELDEDRWRMLEQQLTDLRIQFDERDQDLTAARSANRELIARLNTTRR